MRRRGDHWKRFWRVTFLLLTDILLINLSAFLALLARFDFSLPQLQATAFFSTLRSAMLPFTLLTILIFVPLKLYHSLWKFASVDELLHIVLAVLCVALVQMCAVLLNFVNLPRSFPLLNALFLTALMAFSRFSYRLARNLLHRCHKKSVLKRTMLIGAGSAGMLVLREFQTSDYSLNQIVCIIDDDPRKQGRYLRSVKIVGTRADISAAARS